MTNTTRRLMQRRLMQRRLMQQRRRLARGQAMIEYSIVTHALLLIGAGASLGIGQYLRIFDALDVYLRSIYTVLAMGGV